MPSLHIFEQYLNGRFPVVPAATEADYYALWHARGIDRMAPAAMAVAGALLADRLPWVFTAGYQATLRNAFRQLPQGVWAAFAATEDTQDPRAHPGTTLKQDRDGLTLSGHKSWLAHSRKVDHLIVTINDPGGDKRRARGVIIDRERDGVSITPREASIWGGVSSRDAPPESEPPWPRPSSSRQKAISPSPRLKPWRMAAPRLRLIPRRTRASPLSANAPKMN
jgi:hypothetical protein